MPKPDIDRICAETLRGRFGPRLLSPRQVSDFTWLSTPVDAAVTIRNAAIWTSARSGIEQGKL